MYAIIKQGGRQYKVAPGTTIRVDRLQAEVGGEITLSEVLFWSDGETIKVGDPTVNGTAVKATVLLHDRAKKIMIFKKKRRKGYHKAQGHRQDYTALKITVIEA
ncbi:MAG: 50S ribosomal protein L21 [Deltaproteobacteria bacterium]|jgi:large subunit ribosomal protein L21|nr:50S ribosomal protein L21 [Deltaproteobacteria bacterium]